MRKIRIVIKVSRYQDEKALGERWRREAEKGETYTEFRRRILGKSKKNK